MTHDWTLWQLIDSAFPAAGFAHSGGLEAAWQAGEAADEASLVAFLRQSLLQARAGSLPFVAAAAREPDRFHELDARCHAFLTNHVANRGSTRQGQALLRSARVIFPHDRIADAWAAVAAEQSRGHLAVVFGLVASVLEMDDWRACSAFLFATLRGGVSSAVRLGIIGALRAQRVQHELAAEAEQITRVVPSLLPEQACQTSPLLDLFQATHDRLYSRLFQT